MTLYSSWALLAEKCNGMKPAHRKQTVDQEARNREATLDGTIQEWFPASNPFPSIPNPDDDQHDVLDHVDERRGQEERANRRDAVSRPDERREARREQRREE